MLTNHKWYQGRKSAAARNEQVKIIQEGRRKAVEDHYKEVIEFYKWF